MIIAKKFASEIADLLLGIGAVTFRFDPPYTYTSGLKSPIYLDNRLIISYPKVRERVISFYVQTIKTEIGLDKVEWISATATAAIPQGAWVADRLKLPMVFVRPATKSYGKGNKVEGYLPKGKKVLIIEDHISTAASVVGNAQSIRELGGIVSYCVATTTFETSTSVRALETVGVKLFALTSGKTIVQRAQRKGYLDAEKSIIVNRWFADPPNWAKRHGV